MDVIVRGDPRDTGGNRGRMVVRLADGEEVNSQPFASHSVHIASDSQLCSSHLAHAGSNCCDRLTSRDSRLLSSQSHHAASHCRNGLTVTVASHSLQVNVKDENYERI